MKICALRVRSVGRFIDGVAIENFTGGLDVLVGANELGKTTLFRALKSVFAISYNSASGGALAPITPYGGGSPVIEVEFVADGAHYRLRKQFWGGARAELSNLTTRNAALVNKDAENALDRILDPQGVGWLRDLLFIAQGDIAGQNFEKALRASASDVEQLVRRELSDAGADADYSRVLEQVNKAYAALAQDKKVQPKKNGAWWRAQQDEQAAVARLDLAEAAHKALLERLETLTQLRTQLHALEDATTKEKLAQAVTGAEAEVAALATADQRCRELEPALKLADRKLADCEARANAFRQALLELQTLEQSLPDQTRAVTLARAARDAAPKQLAELDAAWIAGERNAQSLSAALERARQREAHAAAQREVEQIEEVTNRVAARDEDISRFERALANIVLTRDAFHALQATERSLLALAAKIEAAETQIAAVVDILPAPNAARPLMIDGVVISSAQRVLARSDVAIVAPDVGTITVNAPNSADLQRLRGEQQALERQLRVALDAHKLDAVSDGDALIAERQNLEARIAECRRDLARDLPNGRAALETAAERARQKLALLTIPTDDDGKSATELETAWRQADAAARRAQSEWSEASIAAVKLGSALDAAERTLHAAQREQRRLEELLGARELRDQREAEIRAALKDALDAAAEARRTLDAWRAQAGTPDTRAAAGARLDKAREAVAAAERKRIALREELRAVEGAIDAVSLTDPVANVAEAQVALSRAQAARWTIEREARALDLIRRTAAEITHTQQASVLGPLLQRVGQGIEGILKASGQLVMGPGLGLSSLARNGREEPIERLSLGTQEQLALMVRLGLADLAADTGKPLPVVLDDTLVHSDRERLSAIVSDLHRRSARHQVIVFSCRDDAPFVTYGNALELKPWHGP